jgi:UDP-glucose 4-epimerase
MKHLVTGGAGFIGSHLVDQLISQGHEVVVIDNLSSGHIRFLPENGCQFHDMDLVLDDLGDLLNGVDTVFHLAANADVRFGWEDPSRDLKQNVIATTQLATAAAKAGVREIVFCSTGSVYGESTQIPTPETANYPIQTSLYGASKSAAEGYLAAFATSQRLKVTILRFVSVLGPRYTHGHVLDFIAQLRENPHKLNVLGNGMQRKSYMHVNDCVRGLMDLRSHEPFEVFNLGTDSYCTVRDSIGWITEELGLNPMIYFGEQDRGWIGDNPFIYLDVSKARDYGWVTQTSIEESIRDTVHWISSNEWCLSLAQIGDRT